MGYPVCKVVVYKGKGDKRVYLNKNGSYGRAVDAYVFNDVAKGAEKATALNIDVLAKINAGVPGFSFSDSHGVISVDGKPLHGYGAEALMREGMLRCSNGVYAV